MTLLGSRHLPRPRAQDEQKEKLGEVKGFSGPCTIERSRMPTQ